MSLLALSQCTFKETVHLPLGRLGKAWLPSGYQSGVRYSGPQGDTLILREVSRDTLWVEIAQSGGEEYNIIHERLIVMLECDTPYTRIEYSLTAAFESPLSRSTRGILEVRYLNTPESADLRLAIGDVPECLSPGCAFRDSLELRSFIADSVYISSVDTSQAILYLNKSDQVVAFRPPAGPTYERIN